MTKDEENELVRLLSKLEPGFLPFDIFVQIARLTVLSIIEFVPFRINEKGDIEVLLLYRGDNDPLFPGQLHTPGTVIRPGDNKSNQYKAFSRILDDELKGSSFGEPQYVGSILHESNRGPEHAQVYWIESKGDQVVGTWYRIDDLPNNFMESQQSFVTMAAKNFAEIKQI